jgi:predicted ATPase
VVADTDIDEAGVVEAIALLVSKSLVIAETGEERARYRLLDITRSYAQAKLAEAGEAKITARKHALYYLKLLVSSRPGRQSDEQVTGEFRLSSLANIRAGLDWSFSADGDPALGIELVAAASRIYRELSLLAECRQWSERALAVLGDNMRGTRCEMELQTAHAYCLMFTQGNSEQARAAFERGLQIAETLGARFHQFRLLSGLHMYHRRMGDFGQLLGLARQAEAIAPDLGDETAITAANILLGASHHLIGNHPEARIALSASLHPPVNRHRFATNFYGFHRGALIVLGRTLWLQGFPDQAIKAAREAEFEEQQDPVSRCLALIWGMSIFHWAGDWEIVESYVDQLIQYAGEHSLGPYRAVGIGFKGDMLARRGDAASGLRLLRESLGRLQADRYDLYIPWLTCILARILAEAGELGPALDRMNGLFLSSDPRNDAYDLPERLRMRGELLAQAGDASVAESCFRDAIAMADRQTALSWRLRTATSLARLWSQQQRRDEARTMLTETYARFTEGFETADLRAARSLLDELERPVD